MKFSGWIMAAAALSVLLVTASAEAQQRPSRESYMFSYADRNGDGVLSPAEFSLFLYPVGAVPGRKLRDLPDADMPIFAEADRDGSGGISLSEFKIWFSKKR